MTTWSKKNKKQKILPEPKIARLILSLMFVCTMIVYFSSCKPTERIVVKTEYVNQLKYDSIYLQKYDSIYVERVGDTVRFERFKTVFKDRLKIQLDTVVRTDTVIIKTLASQPPTGGVREVNKWGFFDWAGLISLCLTAIYFAFKYIKK